MPALASARDYVSLLERRQKNVEHDRRVCTNCLNNIEVELTQRQQDYTELNHKINMSIQPGVINRDEIYRNIRRQGLWLSQQQFIIHEISELQEKKAMQLNRLEQLHDVRIFLDKKHHNASSYLKKLRAERQRQWDRRTEDEIQEIASYGGKNNRCSDKTCTD